MIWLILIGGSKILINFAISFVYDELLSPGSPCAKRSNIFSKDFATLCAAIMNVKIPKLSCNLICGPAWILLYNLSVIKTIWKHYKLTFYSLFLRIINFVMNRSHQIGNFDTRFILKCTSASAAVLSRWPTICSTNCSSGMAYKFTVLVVPWKVKTCQCT